MSRAEQPAGGRVAVGLRYAAEDGAPTVIAKGHGFIADRIVAEATAAGIPVQQDGLLAQSLARLELDQSIPEELYRAVAQLIIFLMRRGLIAKPTR